MNQRYPSTLEIIMKISLHFLANSLASSILAAGILAGCAATTPFSATPITTQAQATMVADAVNTIEARRTAEALLSPSPTATQTFTVTPTLPAPSLTPLPPTLTPTVTPTPTSTSPALAAQVLKVWTYPSTKTEYHGNEGFGIAIYMKNTGSTAWEPGFQLKLTAHTGPGEITVQTVADLTVIVPPGGKVEFDLWGFGSEHPGQHTYTFKLFTNYGNPVYGSDALFAFTAI
jgi:hypothetical protein